MSQASVVAKRQPFLQWGLRAMIVAILLWQHDTFHPIDFGLGSFAVFAFLGLGGGVFLLRFLGNSATRLSIRATVILITLISLIFLTMVVNGDFSGGYLVIVAGLLLGYVLCHIVPSHTFTDMFSKTMLVISIYSMLVTYVMRPLLSYIPEQVFPRIYNMEGLPFIHTGLTVVLDVAGYYRNFGIFREPGVYGIFLNLALYFVLFQGANKYKMFKALILSITILSTFSPPAYFGLVLIVVTHIVKENNLPISALAVVMLSGLLVLLFVVVEAGWLTIFTRRIKGATLDGPAMQVRLVPIVVTFQTWWDSPLFGHGINPGLTRIVPERMGMSWFYTEHITTSIGAMLVVFGFMFTFICAALVIRLLNHMTGSSFLSVPIILAFFILLNSQLLIYNAVFYILVMMGSMGYSKAARPNNS